MGWDIGGVNTKAARIELAAEGPSIPRALSAPLEMERDSASLVLTLRRLAGALGGGGAFHAVTVDGLFPPAAQARERPLEVAAANWAARARFVGWEVPDCLLVDMGTTSPDVIPIVGGVAVALGRTDPERLLSGELVYTGALRTPVEAVGRTVPLWGGHCPLAAERFAIMADVYLWVGALDAADYSVTAPDGRPRPASSPVSGSPARSAATRRSWTRTRSARSPARSRRRSSRPRRRGCGGCSPGIRASTPPS
jgi:uncharacterized hydantoinase/oxoprolinase family protein